MPMPTEERVSQLVAGLVERRGFDLEGVSISAAGTAHAKVKVTVDSDEAAPLNAVAELSSEVSAALDEAGDFGETPICWRSPPPASIDPSPSYATGGAPAAAR